VSCLGDGAIRLGAQGVASLLGVLLAYGGLEAAPVVAASPSPHWSIVSQSQPAFFNAGDASDAYTLIVRNDGGSATLPASTVTVTDTLPSGVLATKISAHGEGPNGNGSPKYEMTCPQAPVTGAVTCTYEESATHGSVLAGTTIVLMITLSVPSGIAALAPNMATVSGGGAPSASVTETTPLSGDPVPFGLSYIGIDDVGDDGQADIQAGSHPFELATSLAFNVGSREAPSLFNGMAESPLANATPKDLEVAFPPGLLGNPNAVPQCSQQAFLEQAMLHCPLDTQVGTVKPFFYGRFPSAVFPVFNIVPPPGQPAELGFSVGGIGHVPIFFRVRGDGDYGLSVQVSDIPETGPLQGAILTLWGVPADASHDLEREGTVGEATPGHEEVCKPSVKTTAGVEEQKRCPSGLAAKPFLTLPTSCQESPLSAGVLTDSWQSPGPPLQQFVPNPQIAHAITGCEQLSFNPSLALAPEIAQAGAPSGYTIRLHVPQNEEPAGLATPTVRKAVVSLPDGTVISPSATDGLLGCSQEQFGLHSSAAASCPDGSKVGAVKIATPLLTGPLAGDIFLGEPECAPCTPQDAQEGRLMHLLLQAQGSGVTVKLDGSVSIDQATGRLTATFQESPQWPFEDIELTLNGGARAPLANPSSCGTPLDGMSQLTPYSSEDAAESTSEPFVLSGCPAPQFAPSFIAGTTNNQAGAFSPATVTVSRSDQDEDLGGVSVHLPPGLLGMLSSVQACPQSQVQAQQCGAASRLGSASVGAGPGADPAFLAGSVYLTGPYDGAPFGLSILVPANVGPFDLGTIDVRAKIDVDPRTAALSITSDPLPQSLDGIPLSLRTLNLSIDRQGFIFNPTNCQPLAIDGVLQSTEGTTANTYSRFQAANCATLPFKPRLTALTHARTSKAGGAYLHVKLVSGPGQANVAKVKVDLPKHLSTRLTTLQGACAAAVFQADPANCPAASVVGTATALTPVLRQPLTGPAYLVSHGAAALPDLELVLQGEGVTIHVIGQTSLGQGVTSSTFRSLPDAPLSSFDLVLDSGPHGLLAANLPVRFAGNMCGRSLAMATAITAQNGAVLKQTTKVAVSGCPEHTASRLRASRHKA
jgi:uncharacterized repeat protein (TIGR01451 family)